MLYKVSELDHFLLPFLGKILCFFATTHCPTGRNISSKVPRLYYFRFAWKNSTHLEVVETYQTPHWHNVSVVLRVKFDVAIELETKSRMSKLYGIVTWFNISITIEYVCFFTSMVKQVLLLFMALCCMFEEPVTSEILPPRWGGMGMTWGGLQLVGSKLKTCLIYAPIWVANKRFFAVVKWNVNLCICMKYMKDIRSHWMSLECFFYDVNVKNGNYSVHVKTLSTLSLFGSFLRVKPSDKRALLPCRRGCQAARFHWRRKSGEDLVLRDVFDDVNTDSARGVWVDRIPAFGVSQGDEIFADKGYLESKQLMVVSYMFLLLIFADRVP